MTPVAKTSLIKAYNTDVFNVYSIPQAKSIILTPEEDFPTAKRWETETPYLLELISANCPLSENSIVLDYGCGIGRVAKALIEKFNCWVIGIDNENMLKLAKEYINSDKFQGLTNSEFDFTKPQFDLAISIWVLQHCLQPENDVANIKSALKPEAKFFVVNTLGRVLPITVKSNFGWFNDEVNIQKLLAENFQTLIADGILDIAIVGPATSNCAFYEVYEKPAESASGNG